MTSGILEHLERLVGFDTSSPDRTLHAGHPILDYLGDVLREAGCVIEIADLGAGRVNLLARRGTPDLLLNCHLDTVAADAHWTEDPFSLQRRGDRVHGLGACDIKGAAACMLTVAQEGDDDVAFLFNTDEEAGRGDCIGHFLDTSDWRPEAVLVAEPTDGKAVRRHRGFASFTLVFTGQAGHTSMAEATGRSAAHDAVRWAGAALDLAAPGGILEHARFNIGGLEGGTVSNVVNSRTSVRFGFRPRPEDDTPAIVDAIRECIPQGASVEWSRSFLAPPLDSGRPVDALLERTRLQTGPDVDFWTEAALFHRAGLPTIVLGPGDISQAHQADEWVSIDSLHRTAEAYARFIRADLPEHAHAS